MERFKEKDEESRRKQRRRSFSLQFFLSQDIEVEGLGKQENCLFAVFPSISFYFPFKKPLKLNGQGQPWCRWYKNKMVLLPSYSFLLALLFWVVKTAAELAESPLPVNQTAFELPAAVSAYSSLHISSVRETKPSGRGVDLVAPGMLQALRDNELVREKVKGGVVECWTKGEVEGTVECTTNDPAVSVLLSLKKPSPRHLLVCPNGEYDDGNNACNLCSKSCSTCVTSSGNCLTCNSCWHFTTAAGGPGVCTWKCPKNCKVCSSEDFCTTCKDGSFKTANNLCDLCDVTTCLKCSGSSTSCLECKSPNHPASNITAPYICTSTCPVLCETCAYADACDVNGCKDNAVPDGAACKCSDGFFADNGVCSPCNKSCKKCATSESICTECIDCWHFTAPGVQAGACTWKCSKHCKTCGNETECDVCHNGYWLNLKKCEACHVFCKKCTTSATTCTECLAPNHPSTSTATFTCSEVCPPLCETCIIGDVCTAANCITGAETNGSNGCKCSDGFFEDGGICSPCSKSCLTCSGSEGNCLSCADCWHFTVPNVAVTGGTCTWRCTRGCKVCSNEQQCTTCKDGFFKTALLKCEKCDDSCKNCEVSSTNCKECNPSYHPSVSGASPYTCTTACPELCLTCLTGDTCEDCINGYAKVNGICVCPDGEYKSSGVCLPCNKSCKKCVTTENYCTECPTCWHYIRPADTEGTCTMRCPRWCKSCTNQEECGTCKDKYWLNSSNKKCEKCDTSCDNCSDALNCLTCSGVLHFSVNGVVSGLCNSVCPTNCSECSATNYCTTCSSPWVSGSSGSCVCPSTHLLSSTSCLPCDSTCVSCSGSSTNCQACVDGYHFQTRGASSGVCILYCYDNCAICSNSVTCSTCQGIWISDGAGQCKCPATHYLNISVCDPCHTSCDGCSTSATYCTACSGVFHFPTTTTTAGVCETACPPNCSACSTSDWCTNCEAPWADSSGVCVCPATAFLNFAGTICSLCDLTCASCQDSADMCLQCKSPLFPLNSSWPSICESCSVQCTACTGTSTTCQSVAAGFYFAGGQPGPASPCDSTCQECGNAAAVCTVCKAPLFPTSQLPGTCTDVCDVSCATCTTSGTYCDTCQTGYFSTTPGHCSQCDPSCSNCSVSSTTCVTCTTAYFPVAANLPGGCTRLCAPSCGNCSGYSLFCTSCALNYLPITALPGLCSSTCDISCQTCQGTVATCSACAAGYVMATTLPGICTQTCDVSCDGCTISASNCSACAAGYFPYGLGAGKCVPTGSCNVNCLDASSCPEAFTSCSVCASGYQRINAQCVMLDCFLGCATCVGPDYNQCLSCAVTFSWLADRQICQAAACTQSCSTCYGEGAYQCLTCKAHASKLPGTDVCSCDTFYLFDQASGNCLYTGTCAPTCATCSGPFENQCLACGANSALNSDTKCVCATDYTWNAVSGSCTYTGVCEATCGTCSGPSASQCLSCKANASLASQACSCNANYTWQVSGCVYSGACDATCLTCSGPASTQCVSCADPIVTISSNTCSCPVQYIWTASTRSCRYTGPCVIPHSSCSSSSDLQGPCDVNANVGCTACAATFTWDSTTNRCLGNNCAAVCSKCSGPATTDCIGCNEVNYQVLTASGTCACADGYYGSVTSSTSVCSQCDPTCFTCSAIGTTSCSTCPMNSSKSSTNACVVNPGFFWNRLTNSFQPCDKNCLTCIEAATSCVACPPTFTQVGATCVCAAGKALDVGTNSCLTCHSSCATCFGFTSAECRSCPAGQTLLSNACVCNAPATYNNNGVCSSCHEECLTCSGPSATECLTCYSPAILSSRAPSTCQCVNLYKPGPTSKTCQLCPDTCANCDVSDISLCTICKANARLQSGQSPSSCVCIDKFFFNDSTRICVACDSSCLKCSGTAGNCKVCNIGFHFTTNGATSGTCNDLCPTHCGECSTSDTCTSCAATYVSNNTGGCVCPSGQYDSGTTCQSCNSSCSGCSGSSTECLNCAQGYHFLTRGATSGACNTLCPAQCSTCSTSDWCTACLAPWTLSTGQCVCTGNAFTNGSNCERCDVSCGTCVTTSGNCLTCAAGYLPVAGVAGRCQTCDSSCITCSISTSNCNSCAAGYHFTTRAAVSGVCTKACGLNCSACSSSDWCTSCVDPWTDNGSGGCGCTSNARLVGSECRKCAASCNGCSGLDTNCLLCAAGFLPVQSGSPSACQSCNPGCGTCSGTTSNCQTSTSGYYFPGAQPGPTAQCNSNCAECQTTSTSCTACPSGSFPAVAFPGVCTNVCDRSCASCSQSAVKCDSCQKGYFNALTFPAPCIACDSSCLTCSGLATHCEACAASYFPVEGLMPGLCTNQCHASCQNCDGDSKTCSTCAINFLPITSVPGRCSSTCDSSCETCEKNTSTCSVCKASYVALTTLPGTCTQTCNASCNGCSGSASSCTSCAVGYFPYGLNSSNCVPRGSCNINCLDENSCPNVYSVCSVCAAGYQKINSVCVLLNCFAGCATCLGTGKDQCLSCAAPYTLLVDRSICQAPTCSQSCATCYGPGSDQCLSCKPNSSKNAGTDYCACNLFYSLSQGDCVYNGACAATCGSCSGPYASQCTSCGSRASLAGSQCQCDSNYPWDSASASCKYSGSCHSSCSSCSGPSESNCLGCKLHAALNGTSCSCEANYTWNGTNCNYSGSCAATCGTCSGPEANKCLTCADAQATLSSNTCSCPANYTWTVSSLSCVYTGLCPKPFSACSSAVQGTTSDPNSNGTDCNAMYTWDIPTSRCVQGSCAAVCLKCSGLDTTDCVACESANHQALTPTGTCGCAPGYYGTVTAHASVCSQCHAICATCNAAGASACLSCSDNSVLSSTATCVAKPSYYWNDQLNIFQQCNNLCSTCLSSATDCQSCPETFVLTGNMCVCAVGSLLDVATNTCKVCDPTCTFCFGFTSSQCLGCTSDQSLISGVCVCNTENMYNNKGICTPCYDGCKSCTGPSSNQCLSCYSSAILVSKAPSSCLCNSPLKPAPTPKVCQVCPDSCGDCEVSAVSMCTVCKTNQHFLTTSPSACVCNDGFYFESSLSQCAICHQSCSTCSSPFATFCSKCNGVSVMGNLYCSSACPSGFSPSNGQCKVVNVAVYLQPFNSFVVPVSDLKNKYAAVYTGSPKTLYNQGLQLGGSQAALLPPNSADSRDLTLAPSFSVEAWIRPAAILDASADEFFLLSKSINGVQLLSLSLRNKQLQLRLLTYPVSAQVGSTQQLYRSANSRLVTIAGGRIGSASEWTVVRAVTVTSMNDTGVPQLVVKIFVNGANVGSQTFSGYLFRDFSSTEGTAVFIVGAQSLKLPMKGFQGSLAELAINNSGEQMAASSCQCSKCTASGMCLTPCQSSEFQLIGACAPCKAECLSTGCLRSLDCTQSTDPLCSTPQDFTVCGKCKSLAVLKDGQCSCVANSIYNSALAVCQCGAGYKQQGEVCVPCRSYFSPSDLTVTIKNAYTGFIVAFKRPMSVAGITSCANLFTASSIVALAGASCVTLENQKIDVTFSSDYNLTSTTFFIDYLKVWAATGNCSYVFQDLPVRMEVLAPQPPVAVLTASALYSISCSSSGLVLSGSNSKASIPGSLSYKWVFAAEQSIVTTEYEAYSSANDVVTLLNAQLSPGTLTVTLWVKDKFNSAQTSTKVKITRDSVLNVYVASGNSLILPTNAQQRVVALVKQDCSTSVSFAFTWSSNSTGLSAAAQDGVSAVLATQSGPAMTILKNKLLPGTYQFICSVTDSFNGQGSATLLVTIQSSSLVPKCDRSGAPLAPSQALTVDCSASYDPDALDSPPSGAWTCLTATGGACLSVSKTALSFNSKSLVLSIAGNLMQPSETYQFALVVSKGSRSSTSLTLVFPIKGLEGTVVTVGSPNRASNQREFVIRFTAKSTETVAYEVSDPGDHTIARKSGSTSVQVTGLKPQSQGGVFTVEITINVGNKSTVLSVTVVVSAPPTPGRLHVKPQLGTALETQFTLTSEGVSDSDGPDLPLTFSFGYCTNAGDIKLVSIPTTSTSFSTQLSVLMQCLYVQICDSMGSCARATSGVQVLPRKSRKLQTSTIPQVFDQMSLNQDAVFTSCVLLAYDLDLAASDWTHIYSRVVEVAKQFASIDDSQLMAEITCFEALISVAEHQYLANLNLIITALKSIIAQYNAGSYELIYRRQMDALQHYNLNNLSEIQPLDNYFGGISSAYALSNFPDQTSLALTGNLTTSWVQRFSASSFGSVPFNSTNLQVAFPESVQTTLNLQPEQILSLMLTVYRFAGLPSGIMTSRLEVSGLIQDYSWQDYSQPSRVEINGLSDSVNVTLPIYNSSQLESGVQCVQLVSNRWTALDCSVLQLTKSSVTVGVHSLGVITVVPKDLNALGSDPLPYVPISTTSCERYYAPVGIMTALVIGAVLAAAATYLLKRFIKTNSNSKFSISNQPIARLKNEQQSGEGLAFPRESDGVLQMPSMSLEENVAAKPHTASAVNIIIPPMDSDPERQAFNLPSNAFSPRPATEAQLGLSTNLHQSQLLAFAMQPAGSSIPLKADLSAKKADSLQLEEPLWKEVLAGHYLLGWLLCRRLVNLLLLLTVLLSELFFLGVFYYYLADSHEQGTETSMNYFFSSYGQDDVFYYIWSFAISLIISLVLTTCFTPISTLKVHYVLSRAGVAISMALVLTFIVLIAVLNEAVCYEYAGRWSVGFLWAFLTEVLVLEFIVAAYRWLLLKCRKPVS